VKIPVHCRRKIGVLIVHFRLVLASVSHECPRSTQIRIIIGLMERDPRVPKRQSRFHINVSSSVLPPSPYRQPSLTRPSSPSSSLSFPRSSSAPCRNTSRAQTRIRIKQSCHPSVSSPSAHKRGRLPGTRRSARVWGGGFLRLISQRYV